MEVPAPKSSDAGTSYEPTRSDTYGVFGEYWRGRYWNTHGKKETVRDEVTGKPVHFSTKRDARRAADLAEAEDARQGKRARSAPANPRMTFGEYVHSWYQALDLAASTMQNYRRHIENHLLPEFEGCVFREEMSTADVTAWEKKERDAGYAEASIKTWRGTLHLICEDAVEAGVIHYNPATKRRGRGKRAGKRAIRGPEKGEFSRS